MYLALVTASAVPGGQAPAEAAEAALVIARDGKSELRIALDPGAGEVEAFAASELSDYLERITGARLPVSHEPAERRAGLIRVRSLDRSDRPAAPVSAADEGYRIEVDGDGVVLSGGVPRAALYAAYAFLEEAGCRWLAPRHPFYEGIGAEWVPRRPTLELSRHETVTRPAFAYRKKLVEEGRSHTTESLLQLVDWMAKVRLNVLNCPTDYKHRGVEWDNWRERLVPELRKRGMILEVGGHGYQNFLKPEKYFASHPEWFGTDAKGNRSPGQNIVFNTANAEARDKLAEEVVAYLRAHPEIAIFDLFPPDAARWSRDPEALAQGDPPARQAAVLRTVASALETARLPVLLQTIAYADTLAFPETSALPSRLMVDLCSSHRSFACDEDDPSCAANVPYRRAALAWSRGFRGILGVYSYYRKYSWISKPVVLPTRIPRELNAYRALGVQGLGSFAEPADWFTYEYQHYLLARMTWDPTEDPQRVLLDFCRSRYGEAGGTMAEYFLVMETVAPDSYFTDGDTTALSREKMGALGAGLAAASALLDRARSEAAGTAPSLAAVERTALAHEYLARDLDLARLSRSGDREAVEKGIASLGEFLARNGDNGLVVLNDRARGRRFLNRYRPLVPPDSR